MDLLQITGIYKRIFAGAVVIQKRMLFLQTISPPCEYAESTGYQLTQNFIPYSDIVKQYRYSDDLRCHSVLRGHSRICGSGPDHIRGFSVDVRIIIHEFFSKTAHTYNQIRRDFTDKIVFGLEFLIAADILATLLTPTQQDLINLAVVVVIRTILGYFLSKEVL
jgi:uncharacterized membrane protein